MTVTLQVTLKRKFFFNNAHGNNPHNPGFKASSMICPGAVLYTVELKDHHFPLSKKLSVEEFMVILKVQSACSECFFLVFSF